jgi:hypothetical protein
MCHRLKNGDRKKQAGGVGFFIAKVSVTAIYASLQKPKKCGDMVRLTISADPGDS